jgi:homoserine dehydrogenase
MYSSEPRSMRVSIVGFGTVGRWLADAIHRRRGWLSAECGVAVAVTGVATRRDGFVHHEAGFDIPYLLDLVSAGRPLATYPGSRRWATALEGLRQTQADVVAESSNTNPREPEPALSHLRLALERGADVITSSKGACAAAGVELQALARRLGRRFRMESTVMSGTPVLATLREGLAGARVRELRGILNGTANYILTRMTEGLDYRSALAEAQAQGLAEPDPTDDVESHDVVAKIRILAAVAFDLTLPEDQVVRRGIARMPPDAAVRAVGEDRRLKLVATIGPEVARVEPIALPLTDPLARVDGVMNALVVRTDTVREVTIVGPGAGPEQAGQGMFADLVAVVRSAAR